MCFLKNTDSSENDEDSLSQQSWVSHPVVAENVPVVADTQLKKKMFTEKGFENLQLNFAQNWAEENPCFRGKGNFFLKSAQIPQPFI